MNEEVDAVMDIWRNKFTCENSGPTEVEQVYQTVGSFEGAGGMGVPRYNVRPCTVWVPKLVWVVCFEANQTPNSLISFFTLINILFIGDIAFFKFITQTHFLNTF